MRTAIAPQTAHPAGQRGSRGRGELAIIAKARAEIDTGLGIDDNEAWLDQLDIDKNPPLTKSAVQRP